MAVDSPAPDDSDLGLGPTLDGPPRKPSDPLTPVLDESRDSGAASHPADHPVRISRYVILRHLGQGGMGIVYLAYDPDLDRKVAIKLVRGSLGEASLARARVQQEAQALAQVSHPNIVHVYEVGQSSGQIYIAMEYVPGISLALWQRPLSAARPSIEQILRVYIQAAAGLLAAHRSGLVHRDFKPENVLLGDDGRPRVLDFGLARALTGPPSPRDGPLFSESHEMPGERLTQAGAILGTPGYMSPEQVRGEEADARSDQFSFCAALYDALYQRLPFGGDTFAEFAREVLAGRLQPLPPSEVPIPVDQALRRGLSSDPAARYPSMQELIAALETGLHPDSESPVTRRASRRFGLGVGAIALANVAIGLQNRHQPIGGDLRFSIALMAGFLVLLLLTHVALRRRLLRRTSYKPLFSFVLVCVLNCLFGRIFGHALGLSPQRYIPLEMLGLGALLTLEAPHASPRYYWLAALAWASGVILIIWPQLFVVVINTTYMLIAILSAYFRLKATNSPSESAQGTRV